MCYLVVTRGERAAPADVRVRFEFRPDLTDGRGMTVTVLGVDAACDQLRTWLTEVAAAG